MNRDDRRERAERLVNILSLYCDDDSFAAFCESLVVVGQRRVVDTYFTHTDAENLRAPGRHST